MWNDYRKTFPSRYIKEGYFDKYIRKTVLAERPKKILDIGGGAEGTKVLKGLGTKVYLLDPYVNKKPSWIHKKVGWDIKLVFDLIVARGSINYLNKKELSKVKKLLVPGGIFIANTFASPPWERWSERRYKDIPGRSGLERYRYNPKKKIVEHELLPRGGRKIKHSFFYYSPKDYKNVFPGSEFIRYKANSIILYFKKSPA